MVSHKRIEKEQTAITVNNYMCKFCEEAADIRWVRSPGPFGARRGGERTTVADTRSHWWFHLPAHAAYI